jgi:hypothetical protein
MPLTKIQSLGITDGAIVAADIASGAITAAKLASGVGGKVLQVVQGTTTTQTESSSATLADTTLTASITPSSASNKVLVIVHQNGINKPSGDAYNDMNLVIKRGATTISTIAPFSLFTNSSLTLNGQTLSTAYLDSPNTTSSTTYKTQFRNPDGAGAVLVQETSAMSTITLMEIAV